MGDSLKAETKQTEQINLDARNAALQFTGYQIDGEFIIYQDAYKAGATKYAAELSALREERDALKALLNEQVEKLKPFQIELTDTHKELQRVYKLVDTHFNLCAMAERERDASREQNGKLVEALEEAKTYCREKIGEAYKCLETGLWEHDPFDDMNRDQIDGMRRAFGKILIKIESAESSPDAASISAKQK